MGIPGNREVEARTELRLYKKKKKLLQNSKVSFFTYETRDSISDIDMQFNDKSDDKSLYGRSISELETDEEFSHGNFVLARFMVEKKQNSAFYYVGKIEEIRTNQLSAIWHPKVYLGLFFFFFKVKITKKGLVQ
jgi:general stress protein 26